MSKEHTEMELENALLWTFVEGLISSGDPIRAEIGTLAKETVERNMRALTKSDESK